MAGAARVNALADYATLTAYGDARWLDPGGALPGGDDWLPSDIAPFRDSERLITLILPEDVDLEAPFWTLYEPPAARRAAYTVGKAAEAASSLGGCHDS